MALTGLVLGYISILILLLPVFAVHARRSPAAMCASNLKHITVTAHLWAFDHDDVYPADWGFVLEASSRNDLRSPAPLICPSDKLRKPATSWDRFTPGNVTYEMVTPGAPIPGETNVFLRCPIHGHEIMTDGTINWGQD
jgi:hypothetical protein